MALTLPIAHALEQAGLFEAVWPATAVEALADDRRVAGAIAAGQRRVLEEILTVFASAGMSPLLLKGAALGYTVYPAPWLRSRTDTDLLIPCGAFDQVSKMLQSVGFEAVPEVTHPLITRQQHFSRARGLPAAIDVHEALVNPAVLRHLPGFDELSARAQPIPHLHPNARALSTPDALLHALVHRVAHHNSSVDVLWLYDMRLLVAHMDAAAWDVFFSTARAARVCRIAEDGLRVLRDVMAVEVPADVTARLSTARREPSAALLGGNLTELRLQWINFRSLPGLRTKAAFVRAHLTPPSNQLRQASGGWPLSVRYVMRAVRGVRKWCLPIARGR